MADGSIIILCLSRQPACGSVAHYRSFLLLTLVPVAIIGNSTAVQAPEPLVLPKKVRAVPVSLHDDVILTLSTSFSSPTHHQSLHISK
jgi:hypothetical protein